VCFPYFINLLYCLFSNSKDFSIILANKVEGRKMNVNLDRKFLQWLNKIGDKQGFTLDEVADRLARNEIEDREKYFPQFNHIFSQSKYDINLFSELAKQSWPLGQRFDIIRLSGFLNN